MARDPYTPDCQIKGCTRADRGNGLCAMHYAMVPRQMRTACMLAVMTASYKTARAHHRKMIAYVREQLVAVN